MQVGTRGAEATRWNTLYNPLLLLADLLGHPDDTAHCQNSG